MELRDVRSDDAEAITQVVRDAISPSDESLDEATLDAVVEAAMGEDFEDVLTDAETTVRVLVTEGAIVGFGRGEIRESDDETIVGEVHWLAVDPVHGDGDTGARLLGGLIERFLANDANAVRVHVRADLAAAGLDIEEYGFEETATGSVTLAGEDYPETVYERRVDSDNPGLLAPMTGPDGQDLFVDYAAGDEGTEAHFYPVLAERDGSEPYGWRCGNCNALATAMDSSGRVTCEECDNVRTATEWDGAYL